MSHGQRVRGWLSAIPSPEHDSEVHARVIARVEHTGWREPLLMAEVPCTDTLYLCEDGRYILSRRQGADWHSVVLSESDVSVLFPQLQLKAGALSRHPGQACERRSSSGPPFARKQPEG